MLKQQRPKELSSWLPVMELAILEPNLCEEAAQACALLYPAWKHPQLIPKGNFALLNYQVSPSLPFLKIQILQQTLGYCSLCVSAANFTYFYLWFGGFWVNPVHILRTENSVEIPIVFGNVFWCQQVDADKMRLNLVLNHWHFDRCHFKTDVFCFPLVWGRSRLWNFFKLKLTTPNLCGRPVIAFLNSKCRSRLYRNYDQVLIL